MMKRVFLFLSVALMFQACTTDSLLSETRSYPVGAWPYEDVFQTAIDVQDTLTPVNFFFLARNGNGYKYRNLIIYFKTYLPNNSYIVDTINCPLANERGKWLGSGLGDIRDNEILFKPNFQFPMPGTYRFEIQHAMRMDTVGEIYDVGLRIETSSR